MSLVISENCETIVFGKGTGESVLIRISVDEWIIIDSCLDNNNRPAALQYLLNNGVNVSVEVKLIVISHFHDDHISGLAEIIQTCQAAKLVISAALNSSDFKEYIDGLSKIGVEMAKTKEIQKIMNLIPSLMSQNMFVIAKRDCILYRSINGTEIHSLSPSDNDIAYSDLDFVNSQKIALNVSDVALSARKVNPNHYCVVIRILSPASENNEILLGADLEVKNNAGWDSVCDAINSPKPNKASIFKIPHHGSKTGYHPKTWSELLKDKPISVMTTFDKSNLPKENMVEIYKNQSSYLYCTCEPKFLTAKDLKKTEHTSTSRGKAQSILLKMNTSVMFTGLVNRFGYVKIVGCLTDAPSVTIHEAAVVL